MEENIKMSPVISSNISAAGYDEKSKKLVIQFSNGSKYEYNEAPLWIYEGIFKADSPGKFVKDSLIKGDPYKAKKIIKK